MPWFIRTRGILQPIPVEYNSYIIHLIEGFAKAQERARKVDSARAEAEYSLEQHLEHFKAVADEWLERERQYKTEIKRLEVLLSRTSRDGLEAVTLARTNSVVDRDGPQAKQFVSTLKRLGTDNTHTISLPHDDLLREKLSTPCALDTSSDLPHVPNKYMSKPIAKVLDRANDFIMSEKIRRQDAANKGVRSNSGEKLPRHVMIEDWGQNHDALATGRKSGCPATLVTDPELQPLFSGDVFDITNVSDGNLKEAAFQDRQSRQNMLKNLLDYEASHIDGKDVTRRGKVRRRSSIVELHLTLEGVSSHSLDLTHLRGLSGMSGFSFVPGDDASPMLVNDGARNGTTIATLVGKDGVRNKDVAELQMYKQKGEVISPCDSTTSVKSWRNQRSSDPRGFDGQDPSANNEHIETEAVNETNTLATQRSSLADSA